MSEYRVSVEPAYVLHRRAFRETSLIVEIFSLSHGRLGLVAKGARRPRSRWAGALEPLRLVSLSWSGRGELASLTAVELVPDGPTLQGRALLAGLYMNELIMRLTVRHDPHPDLFTHYGHALACLAGTAAEEQTLRMFEKSLLGAIGYALVVEQADDGDPIQADREYIYVREHGPSTTATVGCHVSGQVLLSLHKSELSGADELRQAKRLMRFLLHPHLGDRPLHSRELYRSRG